jgi:hypothetical protein
MEEICSGGEIIVSDLQLENENKAQENRLNKFSNIYLKKQCFIKL